MTRQQNIEPTEVLRGELIYSFEIPLSPEMAAISAEISQIVHSGMRPSMNPSFALLVDKALFGTWADRDSGAIELPPIGGYLEGPSSSAAA